MPVFSMVRKERTKNKTTWTLSGWVYASFQLLRCEGKNFNFTTDKNKIGDQIQQMITFPNSGGKMCGSEDSWTQVGAPAGHSAAVSEFSWSPELISVCYDLFFVGSVQWCFALRMTYDLKRAFVINGFLTPCSFCFRVFFSIIL